MERPVSIVPRTCYKPLATRTPTLVFYLMATLILMAMTEYACHKIPQHKGAGSLSKVTSVINDTLEGNLRRDVKQGRQVITSIDTEPAAAATSSVAIVTDTGFLEVGTTTKPGGGSNPTSATDTGFLEVGTPTPTEPDTTVPTGFTPSGNLQLGGDSTTSSSVSEPSSITPVTTSGFLEVVDGATSTTPAPGATPTGQLEVGDSSTSTSSTSGQLEVGKSSSMFPSTSGQLDVGRSSTTLASTSGQLSVSGGSTLATPSGNLETGTTSKTTHFTSVPTTAVKTIVSVGTTSDGTSTGVFTTAISTVSSVTFHIVPTTTRSSIYPTSTVVNATGTFLLMSDGSQQIPPQITLQQYVLVAFVPIIIAIVFAFPWRILDTTIREMEPFYQLQRSNGALAQHSILLDYTTSYFLTTPFKAAFRGHFYVFFSSLISVAVLVLTPLSSEVVFVSLSIGCYAHPTRDCHATWGIYPSLARGIEAILALIAFLVVLLIIWNYRRESGVYANPLSIAGLGSLYQNQALLNEFRAIDGRSSNEALRKQLKGRRYKLSMTHSADDYPVYGITPVRWDQETGQDVPWSSDSRGKYNALETIIEYPPHNYAPSLPTQPLEERSTRYRGLTSRILYIAVFLLLAGTFTLITYYAFTSFATSFERFMDSSTFGPRFMMTTIAILIKLFWGTIDEDLRRSEPYRRLLAGSATPSDSILVPTYVSPLSAFFPSIYRRHFLIAGVALVAVLADVLPVLLANTVFSRATTKTAYILSPRFAMAILALMMLVLAVLLLRRSHDLHHLPRRPKTVASVLLYLTTTNVGHEGGILWSLRGLSLLRGSERDDRVRGLGKLYGMGDMGDGQIRIDEEWRIPRLN